MEFLYSYFTRYLTDEHRKRVRYRVEHEKRNFITTSYQVLFCLLCKHNGPLLTRKVDLIKTWKEQGFTIREKSCKVRRRQGSRWKNALNYYKNKRWAYLLIHKILSHQLFPYLRGNLLKYTAKIDRCQIFRLLISAQPREKPSNFWLFLSYVIFGFLIVF